MALRLQLPGAIRALPMGATRSAAAAYRETRTEIRRTLLRIDDGLKKLDRNHEAEPRSWAVQGTASAVLHDLSNVAETLESVPEARGERGERTHPRISPRRS